MSEAAFDLDAALAALNPGVSAQVRAEQLRIAINHIARLLSTIEHRAKIDAEDTHRLQGAYAQLYAEHGQTLMYAHELRKVLQECAFWVPLPNDRAAIDAILSDPGAQLQAFNQFLSYLEEGRALVGRWKAAITAPDGVQAAEQALIDWYGREP